jgi:hypothetical protein
MPSGNIVKGGSMIFPEPPVHCRPPFLNVDPARKM